MSTVPVKSLAATIRATQDIWCRRNDRGDINDDENNTNDNGSIASQTLFPSAALQLWDHHLHTSGIIPRVFSVSNQTPVIYEQDWVCSYQSVTCFPQEGLIELTVEDGGRAESHIWVDRVGASTLYLGQLILLYDQVLATSVRVLTRKARSSPITSSPTSSSSSSSSSKFQRSVSVPFTDSEREYFETSCAADDIIFDYQSRLFEKYNEDDDDDEYVAPGEQDTTDEYHVDVSEKENEKDDEGRETTDGYDEDDVEGGGEKGDENENRDPASSENDTEQDAAGDQEDVVNKLEVTNHDGEETYEDTPSPAPPPATPTASDPSRIATKTKKRKLTLSSTLSLETFGTFLPQLHGTHLLTVQVGPQHLDSVSVGDGRFADTTWLAEVAFQALVATQQASPSASASATTITGAGCCSVAIRYRSVALLGNILHCSLHGSDRVCMTRSAIPQLGEIEGNEIVVLIAKAELL